MTTGTPTEVRTGPGTLYVAPLGTAEPTSATAALAAGWRDVGYTDGGITARWEVTTEAVEVDQEFDPIRHVTTSRAGSLSTRLAQISRENLALALNAGADAAETGTLEPPAVGAEVRVMVLHETDDGARWLFRQCFQADAIEISSQKGAEKRSIPVTFRMEKPTGAAPFKVWPSLTTAGVV
jgi:hypothetical protein